VSGTFFLAVQSNQHYLTVLRYIEANPFRAKIVKDSRDWLYSSLAIRNGLEKEGLVIDKGPAKLPVNWNRLVNIDGTAKNRKHPPKPALAFSYQGYKELMTLASIFCRMRRLTQM
jgi:hypothetical protein